VFVGEDGQCKTTILQAIAVAASGPEKANQVAGDLPARLVDVRATPSTMASVEARFGAGGDPAIARGWPGLDGDAWPRPEIDSVVHVTRPSTVFLGT